jgi:hypothetical protein
MAEPNNARLSTWNKFINPTRQIAHAQNKGSERIALIVTSSSAATPSV